MARPAAAGGPVGGAVEPGENPLAALHPEVYEGKGTGPGGGGTSEGVWFAPGAAPDGLAVSLADPSAAAAGGTNGVVVR